jgi:hypothetical protein
MTLKKYYSGVGVAALAVIFLVSMFGFSVQKAKARPSQVDVTASATATTSPTYMTPGTATSTVVWDSREVDSNTVMIQFTASTSAARLDWYTQYSNNYNPSTGNGDWYNEDARLSSISGIDHASTTVTHRWLPGSTTASTSLKAVQVSEVASRWKRIVFFIPVGVSSTNGALYTEIAQKRDARGD